MKDKNTQYTFKPLAEHKFENISEKEVTKILDEKQFKVLNQNKIFNMALGTFKML